MTTTDATSLGAALAARYTLERELGRGGMATVYLAHDRRHDRRVALKVLHPELGATLGPERFQREIQLATRLTHPHILPVLQSGAAAGRLWYAMPYVAGETLRARLEREAQLGVAEAVRIATQVAQALGYAHGQGVVHRDIKPENILLSGDQALVADFGIAKLLDASGEQLTATGLSVGTPAYMSPEQGSGGRVDARSDVYALGCVVYEMLAGAPPFTGPTAQAILARHAVDPVPPLRTVRAQLPPAVERAIERALAKVPADRFLTAPEFADALVAHGDVPPQPRRAHGLRRRLSALGAIAATASIAVAAAGIARSRRPPLPPVVPSAATIAVLPFHAARGDTALTRLGRDLAITVSASLDGVGGVTTTDRIRLAREGAAQAIDSPENAAGLARRLGAGSALLGTLVGDGPNVRLDFGLYDARDGAPLARGITILQDRDSLAALTDSVSWALLRHVWQRGEPPTPSLAAVTTSSLAALRAFLDGERHLEDDEWTEALLAYRSAIAADSTFWLAHFRYSFAQYWGGHQTEWKFGDGLDLHRHELPERERLLVEAWSISDSLSLELERYREITRRFPDYWPAWFVLGDRLFHVGILLGYGWRDAQNALNRAVTLNPRLKPAWQHMFWNSVARDTVESIRAIAQVRSLERRAESSAADSSAYWASLGDSLIDAIGRAGGRITPGLTAQADRAARKAVPLGEDPIAPWQLVHGGFPSAQVDFSGRVLRFGAAPRIAAVHLWASAWAWAERGGWDSVLAVMERAVELEPDRSSGQGVTALAEYELVVLGVWLGTVDPGMAVPQRQAAGRAVEGLLDESVRARDKAQLAWLDGILAFARRDPGALERARQDGRQSNYPHADVIDQSLAAFSRALRGSRHTAGRDLAALEMRCANRWDCGEAYPLTPNIAVHRLAAATWLLEAGDTIQARRLLTWHEVWGGADSFTFALRPLAYLMTARLDEARGDVRLAREHYGQFLRRYDSPTPGQRHLVEEAQAALDRLSGVGDPPVRQ